MYTLETVGYVGILFFVLLYPLLLLRHYIRSEYVYFPPYLYGFLGGIFFYALPYMFLKIFNGWDLGQENVLSFIIIVAGLKAISGESAKRLVARINNKSMYKWRYYLPMGIGFAHVLLLSAFLRPMIRLFVSFRMFQQTGTPVPREQFFFGGSIAGILLGILLVIAAIQMEIGLSVLNGLSRNRSSLAHLIGAYALAFFSGVLLLYPWPYDGLRLFMAALVFVLGLLLVFKNRDAFKKYLSAKNTFRGFK